MGEGTVRRCERWLFWHAQLTARHGGYDPGATGRCMFELYVYPAKGIPSPRTVVYLATYGNFSAADEAICLGLSQAGYSVHAMDPLRYLLHASHRSRVTKELLWEDFIALCRTMMGPPIVVAQPISAGMGLIWAAGVEMVQGIIAIGRAQAAFIPSHIFENDNPHAFFVSRYVKQISPRPLVLVVDGRSRKEDLEELSTLYQMSQQPHRLEKIQSVGVERLTSLLQWIEEPTKV